MNIRWPTNPDGMIGWALGVGAARALRYTIRTRLDEIREWWRERKQHDA